MEYSRSLEGEKIDVNDIDLSQVNLLEFNTTESIQTNQNVVWLIQTNVLENELGDNFIRNSNWSMLLMDLLPTGIRFGKTDCRVISR